MERTAAERERAASERGEQLLIPVGFERAGMKRTFIQCTWGHSFAEG